MPDLALIKKMLLFLRVTRKEWADLAEGWEALGNADEARRARNQQGHYEREIARLLADLPEDERRF